LFERTISDKDTTFMKKTYVRLSGRLYVCERSGDRLFELECHSARTKYDSEDAVRDARKTCRPSLAANLVCVASPVSAAVNKVHELGSEAAAVSVANIAAKREQAKCDDEGLSPTASAFAGALSTAVGGPSGVCNDSAPVAALETLSGQRAAAEKQAAERMRVACLRSHAHTQCNKSHLVRSPAHPGYVLMFPTEA